MTVRHTSGGVRWANRDESATAPLPPPAGDGERTDPVRLEAARTGVTVTVEVRPPGDGYREAAYGESTLGRRPPMRAAVRSAAHGGDPGRGPATRPRHGRCTSCLPGPRHRSNT
ncbi:hypothetical protein ACIQV2_23195 [Streptomyces globosus]|uniref:hypothetical protein n=1 Tax=Streptomyces globosus TaxID=68209 RepID=UPI00380BCE70